MGRGWNLPMTWREGSSTDPPPPEDWGMSVGRACGVCRNPEGCGRGQRGRICEDVSFEVRGCGGGVICSIAVGRGGVWWSFHSSS